MLARTEEELQAWQARRVTATAIDELLFGLIDYAGRFPPAALDLSTVIENYLLYGAGSHARTLGRLILTVNEIAEAKSLVGEHSKLMPVSVIVRPGEDVRIESFLADGVRIEAVECRVSSLEEIAWVNHCQHARLEKYVELPWGEISPSLLDAIAASSLRAKLRFGGVVADAVPAANDVANMLAALAQRRIPFKATAGLHHPLRAAHSFSGNADGPRGAMHGFVNLACAAAMIYFGGSTQEAKAVLEEEDSEALRVKTGTIDWRDHTWSGEHMRELRKNCFLSFGSCSFEEPFLDLEALGWI